jgi:hypothetical protein
VLRCARCATHLLHPLVHHQVRNAAAIGTTVGARAQKHCKKAVSRRIALIELLGLLETLGLLDLPVLFGLLGLFVIHVIMLLGLLGY